MLTSTVTRALVPLIALTALTALVLGASGDASSAAGAAAANRPNVIIVLTDDQTVSEMTGETMPKTMKAIAGHGTTFDQSIVSSPLCCPSRAGFLTGEYPHNSGVFDNEPGYAALIDKTSIVYPWLQAAGYRTGHIGRYLLNYDRATPPGGDWQTDGGLDAPPGLDDWFGYVGAPTMYNGATFSDNGTPVVEGSGKPGYTTRVMNHHALDFIRQAKADPRPFFLMLAHVAPHAAQTTGPGPCGVGGLPIPDGGKLGKWSDAPLPKPPSFDERNVSDKPDWIRTRPHLGHRKRAGLKLGWRCSNASLSTVDDGVAQIVRQLRQQGDLDNTAIFVTSDNGYLFGEHRVFLNKVYPYEEALRVPLRRPHAPVARAPQGPALDGRLPGQQPRPHRDRPRPGRSLPVHGGGRLPHPRRPLACSPPARPQARPGRRGAPCSSRSARTAPAASSPSAAYATSTTACARSATSTSSTTGSTPRPAPATAPSMRCTT